MVANVLPTAFGISQRSFHKILTKSVFSYVLLNKIEKKDFLQTNPNLVTLRVAERWDPGIQDPTIF